MIAQGLYRNIGDTLLPGTNDTISGKPINMAKPWKVYSGYTFKQAKKHALEQIRKEFPENFIRVFSSQAYGVEDSIAWLVLAPNTGDCVELFTLSTATLKE